MVEVITFDLWNTLIANKSYSELRVQFFFQFLQEREVFIPFNELRNAYDKKFHFSEVTFEEIEFRHIYTIDRILNVLKEIKIEISKVNLDLLRQEFESMMLQDPPHLKEGVKKTLEFLSQYYYIGLISNTGVTPGKILNRVLEEYNILQYFDSTVYSDETGLFKPHPKMFKISLEKFKCKPQNAIHIGDLLETDIKGAKDFKMKTIWINDMNSQKSTEIFPDYEIKQISEVIQIVRNLNQF
ncbi:MAG: HAD family hydrolase [Candidatus Thorarchaeota archaeon]